MLFELDQGMLTVRFVKCINDGRMFLDDDGEPSRVTGRGMGSFSNGRRVKSGKIHSIFGTGHSKPDSAFIEVLMPIWCVQTNGMHPQQSGPIIRY